ncbi:MAG: restriction endonuclease [Anaerolineae bacterium]|nr:restriction endonuclease [Anaerolineae bacterium]
MANPITKTHADWLSLIEISGPFISMPILAEVFPQGLEDVPAELARSLRADFEFWQESSDDVAVHSAWVKLVLDSLLGYSSEVLLSGQMIPAGLKAEFPEHEETVRADFVLAEPSSGGGERKPKLLIQVFPPSQDLGKAVTGSRWAASVGTRMMELLHATEVRLGLVTNGEQWMLVDAPRGETTGFTTWYASLWFDERSTLNAFQSVLGVRRFFGVAEDETLESLLARSANHQQEVTDQLGLQVRHAVEILIQAVDKAEQNVGARRAVPVQPDVLYEAALTVMMRLVFLLSAEERKLLPIDDDQYSNYYAVSTLREQLQTLASQQGEEVLERRFDAWSRLLAVFRAVHGGIRHQELNLPAYGGSLFNPDRFPFLEGRGKNDEGGMMNDEKRAKAKEVPLAIDNRTVLHLLDALQLLRVDGEMRRLSFRALDVEQIGHVYEGLLDHKAVRSVEVMLGLGGAKRLEPEMALSKLEQERGKGEASFVAWLKDETQKSPAALKNALTIDIQKDALKLSRLRSACGNDDALLGRILPFAGLIRMDDFGNPAVILPGSVYVTAGTSRRATGSHYTPRSLTEPIVQHTLEPLVYAGVAEGLPREEWKLRSAEELLDLKICDMAMGSAGFLVQVVRYLAERLVESWQVERSEGSSVQTFKPENVSMSDEDLLNYARRLVAERCIYGVDKNPLAVEIAKLSLWLVTLAKEKPFTFLDHALKCGDALVGTSAEDFLRWANRKQTAAMSLDQEVLREELDKARGLRKQLESFVALDVRDAERKSALLVEADAAMEHVKRGADLLAGVKLLGLNAQDAEDLQLRMVDSFLVGQLDGVIDADKHPDPASALSAAKKERVFHWEFEFPEVFERGGFSAFVGNPPFIGGLKISTMFGDSYFRYLRNVYPSSNGTADLCAFFFLRAFEFQTENGTFGLIATNTIAQGDTRVTGLDEIIKNGCTLYNVSPSTAWPGAAAVYVSIVHGVKGAFAGIKSIDNNQVEFISSLLDDAVALGSPKTLKSNSGKSFIGSYVLGMGFTLEPEEAQALIQKDAKNKEVLFPYLNGQDLNSRPDQSPSRWVINFFDWPLETAAQFTDCFEQVRRLVKPERDKLIGRNPIGTKRGKKWWLYGSDAKKLYITIAPLKQVLVAVQTSKYLSIGFQPKDIVYSHMTVVFAIDDYSSFALLTSSFHDYWVRKYASTLETRLRYIPTDCFENFPFPVNIEKLRDIGERYYDHRREMMRSRQDGLTTTYNRFHNPEETTADIVRLRELHIELDNAVAYAYGWNDFDLKHDFYNTAQGIRFSISEAARREMLTRLLKLNHERYKEEQSAMNKTEEQTKKEKKPKKPKSTDNKQIGLF